MPEATCQNDLKTLLRKPGSQDHFRRNLERIMHKSKLWKGSHTASCEQLAGFLSIPFLNADWAMHGRPLPRDLEHICARFSVDPVAMLTGSIDLGENVA